MPVSCGLSIRLLLRGLSVRQLWDLLHYTNCGRYGGGDNGFSPEKWGTEVTDIFLNGLSGERRSMSFEWGSRTYVMGILNVTPDSFSGDGLLTAERLD